MPVKGKTQKEKESTSNKTEITQPSSKLKVSNEVLTLVELDEYDEYEDDVEILDHAYQASEKSERHLEEVKEAIEYH